MGFITRLFKSKELLYLEGFIAELRQDKERLIKELDEVKQDNLKLKEIIETFNKKQAPTNSNQTKIKLSKLEHNVYTAIVNNNYQNIDEVSKDLNIKLASLRVYIGRIRKKGYSVNL